MEKGVNKNKSIIKVAILGPESTGKTTLARELAEVFQTIWVPEFAREYVENLKRPYNFDDVVFMAHEQARREEDFLQNAASFIFYDTELIIFKIWFKEVYHKIPDWIDTAILLSKIDLYLLCYPDLKWEYDPVRENPDKRLYLFNSYKKELEHINANYFIVKGFGEIRLKNAVQQVKILSGID